MSKMLNVGVIQHSCSGKIKENLARTDALLEQAADQDVDLILLPELHSRPYFCQEAHPSYFDWAEIINQGPTSERLQHWAQTYHCVIIGNLFEDRGNGVYHNTTAVYDHDGSFSGLYRKLHVPDNLGALEKYYFSPGDIENRQQNSTGPIVTSLGKIGILCGWDQWFPEAARLMALQGAELLVCPGAFGWDARDEENEQQKQLNAWITLCRANSIANNLPALYANRCGFESSPAEDETGIQFWGHSFICDSQGEVLANAQSEAECLIATTLDLGQTQTQRKNWPFFRDRRLDAYKNLSQRCL